MMMSRRDRLTYRLLPVATMAGCVVVALGTNAITGLHLLLAFIYFLAAIMLLWRANPRPPR